MTKQLNPKTKAERNAWALLDRYRPTHDRDLAVRMSRDLQTGPVRVELNPFAGRYEPESAPLGTFKPKENLVEVPMGDYNSERPETIMHELQHALDYRKDPLVLYRAGEAGYEGDAGVEHHAGMPGVSFTDYLSEALPFIKTQEQDMWIGKDGADKRAQTLAKYPWLSRVEAGKSNRMPTPWDVPNAPTLQKQVRDYVNQQE